MKIKKIRYLVPPTDLVYDLLDVFVTVENDLGDEFSYVVEVTTPECLSDDSETSESGFVSPCYPVILVSKLTDEIIHAAIQSFIETEDDLYWLKLYHIAPLLTIEEIDAILDRKNQERIEFEAKIEILKGLDKLTSKIKKLDQLEQSTKSDLVASFDQLCEHIKM